MKLIPNHLQEVSIMNLHIQDQIFSENALETMRSIELFIAIFVITSVVGFVCLAVA